VENPILPGGMCQNRSMLLLTRLFIGVIFCNSLFAAETTRYFKEDHLTRAEYIALMSGGGHTVTGVEHMGISVEESGSWSKSGTRITFAPTKPSKPSYSAADVKYRRHRFLSLEDASGASIAVPVKETKRDLDQHHKTLPPYVFLKSARQSTSDKLR
jgi:hypothetical protein